QQGDAFDVDDALVAAYPGIGGAADVDQQGDGDAAGGGPLLAVQGLRHGQAGAQVGGAFGAGIQVDLVAVQLAAQPLPFGAQHFEAAAYGVQHAAVFGQGLV